MFDFLFNNVLAVGPEKKVKITRSMDRELFILLRRMEFELVSF